MRTSFAGAACLLTVASLSTACDSDTQYSSPTAPPPVESFVGSFSIRGAEPVGDCVAKEFSRDQGRVAAPFTLDLPGALSSPSPGRFTIWYAVGCDATSVSWAPDGSLVYEIESYCEWENSDWSYAGSCGEVANTLVFSKILLPPPVEGRIQGTGTITLTYAASATARPIELAVEFDLRH